MMGSTLGNDYKGNHLSVNKTQSIDFDLISFYEKKNRYHNNLSMTEMDLKTPTTSFRYQQKTDKFKRYLVSLSKEYNQNSIIKPIGGFRNRPMVNLNRGDLDFNPVNLIEPSPTNRVMVTPYRRKSTLVKKINKFGEFRQYNDNSKSSLNNYIKELSRYKETQKKKSKVVLF